jgi:hypothetical protein
MRFDPYMFGIKRGLAIIMLPVYAMANSYCGVSKHSPTFEMNFAQIDQLIWKKKPKASVECGVLKNLYKLEDGHTTEEHYKNVVLLIDNDDERFVAVAKLEGLSVFAYMNSRGDEYHVAVKGDAVRLRPLAPGALAVINFQDVTLPDGFSIYMPVFERVF